MSTPPELHPIFERYLTVAFASAAKDNTAITMPLTPYVGPRGTLDVTTGLTYPTKAERARRNPNVALLYFDPKGSGVRQPLTVLVQGKAAVRDRDLQANTDRYVRDSFAKVPAAVKGLPRLILKFMGWYFTRIYIETTPAHIYWWAMGREDAPPCEWHAPAGAVYPAGDPAPPGSAPSGWKAAPRDWKTGAQAAVARLGLPVLSTIGEAGLPVLTRAKSARLTETGFVLDIPAGLPFQLRGAGTLTFSYHPEQFTGQLNAGFRGVAAGGGTRIDFAVERQLSDWSAGGDNRLAGMMAFVTASLSLRPRLAGECARHGQPIPRVNLP
jgi:hypothetical protein